MADWSKADLAEKVLTYLGVKAQGQNVSGDDSNLVQEVIDSVVDGLRPTGAVYFQLSAIPEWAQWPLTKLVAVEVAPVFGKTLPPGLAREARGDFVGGANTAQQMRPAKGPFY